MAVVFSMAMDTPQTLGLIGILRKALQLPTRNVKLMVSNTLLVLTPFLIMVAIHNFIAGPFLIEIQDHDFVNAPTQEFLEHVRILMVLEAIFFLVFYILSLFVMAMTVNALAATYIGNCLNLKDVFSRTVATGKRPVITCFYIVLMNIAYAFLVALLLGAFVLIMDGSMLIACISVLGILGLLFYLYLEVVWLLGLAISIVEEACYGIKALEKAKMLMKGRKLQGYALMLFLVLLTAPIWALLCLNTVADEIKPVYQYAIEIVEALLVCLMKLFAYAVYTVFYYQCRGNGEKEGLKEGTKYNLVSSDLGVNDSLA